FCFFFFQAEDGIRDRNVTGVQTCALPICYTIPIALLADWAQDVLANQLSAIMMIMIVITAIMSVLTKIAGEQFLGKTPFFKQLFNVSAFWTLTRVLAAIFSVMVFFRLGPEAIHGGAT